MSKPVLPPWAKQGCNVISEWEEAIESGDAMGVARWVAYSDAKNNLQKTMKWVKWDKELYATKKMNEFMDEWCEPIFSQIEENRND